MILGAGVGVAVEEAELVSRTGAVGAMRGVDCRWQGEADGDVGGWEVVVDGLLEAAGVGMA